MSGIVLTHRPGYRVSGEIRFDSDAAPDVSSTPLDVAAYERVGEDPSAHTANISRLEI